MADYGHSRAYQLLPNFADHIEVKPKDQELYSEEDPSQKDVQKKRQDLMQATMKLRRAKASVVRQTVTIKSIKKNKEKYDIKKIVKD